MSNLTPAMSTDGLEDLLGTIPARVNATNDNVSVLDQLDTGPLDRPLRWTLFDGPGAAVKHDEQDSLRQMVPALKKQTADAKATLPWIKLARFGDTRSAKGSLRYDGNVLTISGIEADYDGEAVAMGDAARLLRHAGIAALLYTSPSHTDAAPRWRVLCPLAADLTGTPAELRQRRAELVGRVNGVLGGVLSSESFTLSQSYYAGSVNSNPAHRVVLISGDAIDQRHDLPAVGVPAQHSKVTAPAGIELDTPANIARASSAIKAELQKHGEPAEGAGSDNRAYSLAAEIRGLGLSAERTADLLHAEWAPHFDRGWIEAKAQNADRYGQNEAGAWATGTAAEAFGKAPVVQDAIRESGAAKTETKQDKEPDDEPAEVDESWAERVRRFRGVRPSDGINLPPIRFLDPAEKTLPLTQDGAVLLWYGPRSAVKTANAMCRFMRAIKAHLDDPDGAPAVRVAYCVGEGLHGFLRQRVPAIADHFGLSLAVLDRYWRTVPVPTLDNGGDVKAFCAALADLFDGLPPTVLVVDTFATAAGAVDENSAEMGKLLLSSGPVGRIKRRLGGPLVVVISHAGKDEDRGARGHSSQQGNVDGIERHQFNKETRVQLCHVEKMRDAEDGFTVEYHVSPAGSVPIVTLVGRVDGKGADTATKGGDRVAGYDRLVLDSLRWMASWRKDRTTTKDLYLAVCRMDDTWLADPDHHGPDAVLAGKITDAEAAGWNAARQRLNDLARDRKGRLGSAKIATKGHSDRGWTWWPYEAPGADLDD